MSFDTLMISSATVNAVTETSDVHGTFAETTSARYSAMPCRLQPMSGGEQVMYQRGSVEVTHKMFCPGDYSGIVEHDQIVIDGVTYDVQLVRNIDKMGHHYEIELREIRESLT